MTRRFPIRRKLMAALAVPMVALASLAAFEVFQTRQSAQAADEQAGLARATTAVDHLAGALLHERGVTDAQLRGILPPNPPDDGTVEAARPVTDAALDDFTDAVARGGPESRSAFRAALDAIERGQGAAPGLAAVRAQVDQAMARPAPDVLAANFDGYGRLVRRLYDATVRASAAFDDPGLRQGAELVGMAIQQRDTLAEIVRLVTEVAVMPGDGRGLMTSEQLGRFAALHSTHRRLDTLLRNGADGGYRALVDELDASARVQRFAQTVETAAMAGVLDVTTLREDAAGSADTSDLAYQNFSAGVAEELRRNADDVAGGAGSRQKLYAAFGLLVILGALAVAWVVSRSITRPLRSLTDQATDMADRRLPDAVVEILATPLGDNVVMPQVQPVQVDTRDEVADVAEALNTVQDSALELAVEQAVLRRNIADSFVNLGRRNQNLLGRQLDFITELEHNETDPDTLGNLFRLDHLATRMRRNAESLLVLAGIEPPRKWAAPVKMTDVIRAALGEVEDYKRVMVRSADAATIIGSAAADVAHVLAELIENALIFSPPDQAVEVRGRLQATAPGAMPGYTMVVIDAGLGMTPEDLARSNRRLAGTESFTIAPSRYLGHYVAGNLAARHGIAVHLQNNVGPGIAATVELPPTLLTADPRLPEPDAAFGAPQLREAPPPAPTPPPPPPSSGEPPPPPPTPMPLPATTVVGRSPVPATGWGPPQPVRGPAPVAAAAPQPSVGGLVKRVPGAQLPPTEPIVLRRNGEPRRSGSAPEVQDFLTSLQAGIHQGRQEADH